MRSFDCLSVHCPIFGPHLLEASAGTGKTFAIEHVFVRLLLEAENIEIEQILAVTFTRAAVRDLKKRIRMNLQEALSRIQTEKPGWEYLDAYLGSAKALRKLTDSLLCFDRCQIFTIHGFCFRMLQEFAFEAGRGFKLQDPDQTAAVPKRLVREARKFLETGVGLDLVCPEQMAELLQEYDHLDEIARDLVKKETTTTSVSFSILLQRFSSAWSSWKGSNLNSTNLLYEFTQIASGFKKKEQGDFEAQIMALCHGQNTPSTSLRLLLKEKGSLFKFLDPQNKKVRSTVKCPEFFEWASKTFLPMIREGMDRKKIFACLQAAWISAAGPILEEEQYFDPDALLKQMKTSIEQTAFASSIRQKYAAAIVDEFQDTDPLQWEILKILFLNHQPEPIAESQFTASKPASDFSQSAVSKLKAFYLVGDPKQSIYRFRKADVYTYFEARSALGSNALFHLDTNYRSSPGMIDALNALFDRNWLPLPKHGQIIPSPSVQSGAAHQFVFQDAKGAIHFIIGNNFERCFLPYAISEIERLRPSFGSLSSFAVLVKDRYEAETALRQFQERSISAFAKSRIPLGKTLAFQSIRELFRALFSPRDISLWRSVKAGPFHAFCFKSGRLLLEKQDLISLCRQIYRAVSDLFFQNDLKQVLEEILAWERKNGFSSQGLLQFMDDFAQLDPEEGGRKRLESDADAVQILTLHVSKGLEFDVVFAIGLASRPPEDEDEPAEAEAEKLRHLYVAMTRAKSRLYVPISLEKSQRHKAFSPMELFCQTIEQQEGEVIAFLDKLSKTKSLSYEHLPSQIDLPPLVLPCANKEPPMPLYSLPVITSSFLHSFTTLAHPQTIKPEPDETQPEGFTAHTMPRGIETGILIHQIFEHLFASRAPIWKNALAVEALVSEHIHASCSLFPWKTAIFEMIWKALTVSIDSNQPFTLAELSPGKLQVEMEFLFSAPPHFVKGFIDLVFMHNNQIYFLDWKTNWLGPTDASYVFLDDAMSQHDYWLQAKLYAEALRRNVKRFYIKPFEEIFGGAIYLFLRGGGVCHFKPALFP